MKNKKGFTLIELMVVVVIIGILAAVAVPKLFGMIAKSKASEVGPAAGTYVKMQQAYFSESNYVGSWTLIGYKAPGTGDATGSATTNFTYTPATITGGSTDQAVANAWSANNKVKLNDCTPAANNWAVKVTPNNATGSAAADVAFESKVTSDGCRALTPTFETIGN
jgi:prepilin-type N-terminal cleavage/methylation domain-containing protein